MYKMATQLVLYSLSPPLQQYVADNHEANHNYWASLTAQPVIGTTKTTQASWSWIGYDLIYFKA